MTIDLDDIKRCITEGKAIGDDRMSDTQRDDAFSALAELLAEVERVRELLLNAGWPREADGIAELAQQAERAAVVAWLRAQAYLTLYEATTEDVADAIERGEHRRKKP